MQPVNCPMCEIEGWGIVGIGAVGLIIAIIAALISVGLLLSGLRRHFRSGE